MNRCLEETDITKWKDHPDPKRPQKGTNLKNYRPITCLLMMWKILTAQIWGEIYYLLIRHGLFSEEQKRCCKGKQEQEIYYTLINTSSRRSKQDEKMLAIAWIDYKKAYNMVLQSWMIHCFKMYKISNKVKYHKKLTAGGKSFAELKSLRGISKEMQYHHYYWYNSYDATQSHT